MNKLISVVIPAYNSALYIKEAVDSVINQTYQDCEIIIIDDGSTDDTRNILDSYIKNGDLKYFYINNSGPAAARNFGIGKSQGEFIAFLDADDIWLPNKLERQIPLFDDPGVSLVYSDMEFFGDSFDFMFHSEMTQSFYRGKRVRELIRNNFIPTSSAVIRKNILEHVGFFNEDRDRFKVGEDYELWLRIANFAKIDFVPESLVKHRIHKDQCSRGRLKSYQSLFEIYKIILSNDTFRPYRLLIYKQYVIQSIKSLL